MLTPNFSTSQSLPSPSDITFVDTSTGSDSGLTSRRIYIRLANANYLTTAGESTIPAYETWSISDAEITLSLLSESTTAQVTVVWLTGSVETYTKTELICWDLYDYIFAFQLIQTQTSKPTIISDQNYYSNYLNFIVNIFSAESACTLMGDIYSSQSSLNRNQYLISNQNLFF